MKYTRILRIFSIAIILALLVAAVPATPAQAVGTLVLVPDEGKIGDEIVVAGEGFNKSTATSDKYAAIFFSSQEATLIDDIDEDVTIYEKVEDGIWLDENGEFEVTFTVPTELNDGSTDRDVTTGTYYVYACHYVGTTLATRIRAIAEFTVIGGEITLDLDSGPVGTEVEITGTDFSSNESITIEYDGSEVDIEDGDTQTTSGGSFTSIILIPESTAGAHTITVTVAGSEVEAEFTVEPEIFLNPLSGSANTTVTVSGTGFARRQEVVVYFNNVGLATATTSTGGSFDTEFIVPELGTGIYDVEAEDEDENLDTAKFTITVPPPPSPEPTPSPAPPPSLTTASISSTTGPVGSDLIVGGAGFEAEGDITIKWDDEEVATVTADASGIFVAAFRIPASKHGDHTITISDGTNTHELTFTVESTPPPVPTPLLPEMGVKVKSPISFDWEDVTDESLPVTYTLQIASNRDFSDASMVLEKAELTESEYTVTPEEELKLVPQEAPYYWRIRAIDGALNEGDWTGAGIFYVTAPFGMPSWALYALIGLGGLLLFIIGYWLGRRTAYY
ncbi:MAG: IPT/TIG domain-containing protein [Dehalococcoidales bacterium]